MDEREKFVLRAVLLYAQANLSDVNEAFEAEQQADETPSTISVNGDPGEPLTENELDLLLRTLQ